MPLQPRPNPRPLAGFPQNQRRRNFLKLAGLAAGSALLPTLAEAAPSTPTRPSFPSSDPRWLRTWDAALATLAGNVKIVPHYEQHVLFEGAVYPGIWQECGPHEGLVYGTLAPYIGTQEGVLTPLQIA